MGLKGPRQALPGQLKRRDTRATWKLFSDPWARGSKTQQVRLRREYGGGRVQ